MTKTKHSFAVLILSLLFLSTLSGCGGESSSSSSGGSKSSTVKLTIINEQGNVLQGSVTVLDKNKKEILAVALDGTSPYALTINSEVTYPLLISVSPDPKVYDYYNQPLKAILAGSLAEKLRVSVKSTSAVEYIESQLGGVFSKENIGKASLATMTPEYRPARSYKGGMAKISGK